MRAFGQWGAHLLSQDPLTLVLDFSPQARLAISATQVVYERSLNTRSNDLGHLLTDWALPLVLMLRHTPAIHAAAVQNQSDGATLLCGLSGAGKSTMSYALDRCGHPKLSDDISAVSIDGDKLFLEEGLSHSKLLVDTLERFGIESIGLRPVLHKAGKYVVPPPENASGGRKPIREIVELVKGNDSALTFCELKGLEKIAALDRHTAGNTLMTRFGLRGVHILWLTKIAERLPVYRLTRPSDRDTTSEIVCLLKAHWAGAVI